ncbi:MAG TPA: hypothetical protein VGF25_11985 [Thermoleophilaceae bacterium]|jgi:hypothetical protein
MKPLVLALVLALAALAAGCGDSGSGSDAPDKRTAALDCLTQDKGIDAREEGEDEILIGDADTGPKIKFFLTSGEAEGAEFLGQAEGAEQIGATLLYVRKGSDDLLKDVEFCLDNL